MRAFSSTVGTEQGFPGAAFHAAPNTFWDESVPQVAMSRNDLGGETKPNPGLHYWERSAPRLGFLVISTGGCSSFRLLFCVVLFVITAKKGHSVLPLGKGKDVSRWDDTSRAQCTHPTVHT